MKLPAMTGNSTLFGSKELLFRGHSNISPQYRRSPIGNSKYSVAIEGRSHSELVGFAKSLDDINVQVSTYIVFVSGDVFEVFSSLVIIIAKIFI